MTTRSGRILRVALPVVLILVWLAGAAVGGPYFGRVDEVSTNDRAAYLPSSAESTVVGERLTDFTGDDTIPAVIVVESPDDLSPDNDRLTALSERITEVLGVDSSSPAVVSDDARAAQLFVQVDADGELREIVEDLRETARDAVGADLEVWVTGAAGFSADLSRAFTGIDGLLLGVALIAVFVILVIVYRSPLLPVLVLMTSTFALCVALLTVWWLARAGIVVLNGQIQGILFILVIGAATDYALLYVARFREALAAGQARWPATWTAWRRTIEPVAASGGTVIAGLLCLLLSDLATNRALGPIASIGIVFAMLAALTFLPALLAITGRAAFWPFSPREQETPVEERIERARGVWPRTARAVARHPRRIWIACTVALLVGAAGVVGLKADGVAQSELVLGESEARDGQVVLAEHFDAGSGSPAYVLVPEDRAAETVALLEEAAGVASVGALSADSVSGTVQVSADGGELVASSDGPPGAEAPAPTVSDGDLLLVATLADAADSLAAEETVEELRGSLDASLGDAVALVGGTTATDLDTNDTSIRDRTLIIPVILAVVLLILMVLLRSVLAPVLLILSVVVSFATALGVSAVVFNTVFAFPGADPVVPLYAFVFLVALGIDYNIFLMSRVREESVRHGTRTGILRGLVATGGVITSAGLVLAATFAALGVIPILFLAQLAFIVAFGVLLDTLLVRSLLIPALTYDIGRAIWWPSDLSRRIPREEGPGRVGSTP